MKSPKPCSTAVLLGFVLVLPLAQRVDAADAAPTLSVATEGIQIQWGDNAVTAAALPTVKHAALEEREVGDNDFYKWSTTALDVDNPTTRVDAKTGTVTHSYDWGTMTAQYRQDGDVTRIQLSLTNNGEKPIAKFHVELLQMRLSDVGDQFEKKDANLHNTLDQATAVPLKTASGTLYACYESFHPPVRFGLRKDSPETPGVYPLTVAGSVDAFPKGGVHVPAFGIPQIPPGETLTLDFALRFQSPGRPKHVVLDEFYKNWRGFQEPDLDWPDRRPIGAAFMASEFGKTGVEWGQEGTNPRRLFSPPLDVIEVDSPQGRAMVRKLIRGLAYTAVWNAKQLDAQGIIMWNMELGEHATGFVGDPRMLPILAPEIDEAMDEYFTIIRQAGLTPGCTIRPPQMRWSNGRWVQGAGNANPSSDPVFTNLQELIPEHIPWWHIYPLAQRMSDKIDYAKKRWGCRIFYVDTSIIHRARGMEGGFKGAGIDAHIYRRIRQDHPNVLIIPEIMKRHHAYLAHLAPYQQTGYGLIRPMLNGHYTRDLYPDYFGLLYVHGSGGDPMRGRADRIHEVVWGTVLCSDVFWVIGPLGEAVREFWNQASASMRRATSFARRYVTLDSDLKALPFPYAMRNGNWISAEDLVLNPPANPQIRSVTASSPDKSEAMLLLGWYGWPYAPGTTLKTSLPGVHVEGKFRHVYDMRDNSLLSDREKVTVPSAPHHMFRALYVRGGDTPPQAPRPEGVDLVLGFDDGLAPTAGGGLLNDHGTAKTPAGKLQLTPDGGSARYALIPDWLQGTMEFDLTVQSTGTDPLPIVRFKHYMDTSLDLVRHEGSPALRLVTHERNAKRAHYKSDTISAVVFEDPVRHEQIIPLPKDQQAHRLTFIWESGTYRLLVDGELMKTLAPLAGIRWRDDSLFEPGLVFGPEEKAAGDARASIDNVILYNWAWSNRHAKDRPPGTLEPFNKPDDLPPSIWVWGNNADNTNAVLVNYARCTNGLRAKNAKGTFLVKDENGTRRLRQGSMTPFRGRAIIELIEDEEAKMMETAELDAPDEPKDDLAILDAPEFRNSLTEYVLHVSANAVGENPPERRVTFKYGLDGETVFHWD